MWLSIVCDFLLSRGEENSKKNDPNIFCSWQLSAGHKLFMYIFRSFLVYSENRHGCS